MCGGSAPAKIYAPDTGAYDALANQQMELMRQQQSNGLTLKQGELNNALAAQQSAGAQLRDVKIQRANDTAANAARLAAILGPPPPEKVAKKPVVGQNRSTSAQRQDRDSFRIERDVTATAAGSGLNIV
jgi:hypothetical protein